MSAADSSAAPRVTLVVAVARNGVIGREGQLPWHLPADLKHFKAVTLGKPIIMGRRTFESIGRPLPGRRNIVLSRSSGPPPGAEGATSLQGALSMCAGTPEACVIGGGEIFRLALPLATRVELTRVHADIAGDVHFPELPSPPWREIACAEHPSDERHAYAMSFQTWSRDGR